MSAQTEWQTLSASISGVWKTAEILYAAYGCRAEETAIARSLVPLCKRTWGEMEAFYNRAKSQLDDRVRTRMDEFLRETKGVFEQKIYNSCNFAVSTEMVGYLVGLQTQIDYLMTDRQSHLRNLLERTLVHLQSRLVADDGFRETWQKAFREGEVKCEQLGECQMLLHGIWPIKAYSKKERTDLLIPSRQGVREVVGHFEGAILTEWKKIEKSDQKLITDKCAEARQQAHLYESGSLSGMELHTDKYIIIVSSKRVSDLLPEDEVREGVAWNYRNIAVDPETPSKAAPTLVRRGP